ncbi:MAG: IclR family transcriptional regulator [Micrococcaceae bacterium]
MSSKFTAAGRVLAVLDTFDGRHDSLSLSSIASRAGLTLPTAHRLVNELVDWGALIRLPCKKYVIGLKLLELGSLAGHRLRLKQLAFPHLHALHRTTRTNIHLSVAMKHDVLYLESLMVPGGAPVSSRFGDRWPMHATATGRVLLASSPPEQMEAHLSQPLKSYTPATVTDPVTLRQVLAEVRQRGVAIAFDQIVEGVTAVAAPIIGSQGRPVAAVGMTAPTERCTPHQLLPALTTTAHRISLTFRQAEQGSEPSEDQNIA